MELCSMLSSKRGARNHAARRDRPAVIFAAGGVGGILFLLL